MRDIMCVPTLCFSKNRMWTPLSLSLNPFYFSPRTTTTHYISPNYPDAAAGAGVHLEKKRGIHFGVCLKLTATCFVPRIINTWLDASPTITRALAFRNLHPSQIVI